MRATKIVTAGLITASVVAALAAVCTPTLSRADSTDTGQLVLQLKFKPAEALRYQTSMQIGVSMPAPAAPGQSSGGSAGATTYAVNAVQDIKVRRAGAAGGDLDVVTTGQNSLPGQPPILSNDTRPVLMSYDVQGKLTAIKRQSESTAASPMFAAMLGQGLLSMQGVVLPAKAVRIGETWTQKVQIPGITGSGASTIKTTLVRVENVNKYRTARLHVVITTPVTAYIDAGLQPVAKPSGAAGTMTGTAVVTDEINFAIAEGRVVRSISKGVTSMTVAVGRPPLPDPAPAKRRKKGAPAPAAAPTRPGQTLQMTVRTDIDTSLVEVPKKLPGTA